MLVIPGKIEGSSIGALPSNRRILIRSWGEFQGPCGHLATKAEHPDDIECAQAASLHGVDESSDIMSLVEYLSRYPLSTLEALNICQIVRREDTLPDTSKI